MVESPLGRDNVVLCPGQAQEVKDWNRFFPERVWSEQRREKALDTEISQGPRRWSRIPNSVQFMIEVLVWDKGSTNIDGLVDQLPWKIPVCQKQGLTQILTICLIWDFSDYDFQAGAAWRPLLSQSVCLQETIAAFSGCFGHHKEAYGGFAGCESQCVLPLEVLIAMSRFTSEHHTCLFCEISINNSTGNSVEGGLNGLGGGQGLSGTFSVKAGI
jgi:hypothetical protein